MSKIVFDFCFYIELEKMFIANVLQWGEEGTIERYPRIPHISPIPHISTFLAASDIRED